MPGGWSAVDLVKLTINEDPEAFYWTLQVAGYDDAPGAELRNGDTRTIFQLGEKRYAIQMGRDLSGHFYGWLAEVGANDFELTRLAILNVEGDPEAGQIHVAIPRGLLRDEAGAPPAGGRSITELYTVAYSQFSLGGPDPEDPFNCCADAFVTTDRMPDAGTWTAPIRLGGTDARGGLSLQSDAPYRATNGGQTFLKFEVEATSDAPRNATVALRGVPDAWSVTTPDSVTLPAGEAVKVPVLVTTPARHQHGGTQNFTLAIESDDAWATIDLGIHYLEVPQPAGHHDTLYFHVRHTPSGLEALLDPLGYSGGQAHMVGVPDTDPEARPVDSTVSEFGGHASQWHICLSPSLLLGLDFDLNGTGRLQASFEAQRPYGVANVTGQLLHFSGGEVLPCDARKYRADNRTETLLAEMAAPPQELGRIDIDAPVTPLVDRVPYQKGAALMLVLRLDYANPDSQGPGPAHLLPGGSLKLPLFEYSDAPAMVLTPPEPQPAASAPAPQEDEQAPATGMLVLMVLAGVALARKRAGRD